MEIRYRILEKNEIDRALFAGFHRRQNVTKCWRREGSGWVIRDAPFVDQWSEEEYEELIRCLKHTIQCGGMVMGAFAQGILKGFVSVEAVPMGSRGQYRDLTSLHVSEDRRGNGIGRQLFLAAAEWAKKNGGEKLYISSHSAVETQAFYQAMGCKDAEEYSEEHVTKEPYDRQLEYPLASEKPCS